MENKELIDGLEEQKIISEINIIPFIDIMLVLLIIFMVTAPLILGGAHINLPKSAGLPLTKTENPIIVTIDAENKIFIDNEQINLNNYQDTLKELASQTPNGEVFLKGDGEIKYAKMMELMGELGKAGFSKVVLVTQIQEEPIKNNNNNE